MRFLPQIKVISSCNECPFYKVEKHSITTKPLRFCTKNINHDIQIDSKDIPDWCPLHKVICCECPHLAYSAPGGHAGEGAWIPYHFCSLTKKLEKISRTTLEYGSTSLNCPFNTKSP
jgi:hypothetical protein